MTAVALVCGLVGWHQLPKTWAYALIALGAIVLNPILGVAALCGFVALKHWRVILAKRSESGRRDHDVLVSLDLISLGTTAGLPFHVAVSLASQQIGGELAIDLDNAVARTNSGLDHALGAGPIAQAFDAAQRSSVSGSRLGDSLVDLATEVRAEGAAEERERIERLPVKLLFPLAFLILPGFVLVAVVPSIVSGISQLRF